MSKVSLQSVDITLDLDTLNDDELYDIALLSVEKMSDSSMTRLAEEVGGNHFKTEQAIALVDALTAQERLEVLQHFAEQEAGAAAAEALDENPTGEETDEGTAEG